MGKKPTYILLALASLTVLSGLHKWFVGMGRINPFIDYEYFNSCGEKGISVSIFVYELSYMFEILVVLILLRYLAFTKATKNVISPFIAIATIDILDYLWFYKQLSYYKLPLLIVLIFLFTYKWKKSDKK